MFSAACQEGKPGKTEENRKRNVIFAENRLGGRAPFPEKARSLSHGPPAGSGDAVIRPSIARQQAAGPEAALPVRNFSGNPSIFCILLLTFPGVHGIVSLAVAQVTVSTAYGGEFPSGQRGQTVNLLSLTSVVRIHLPPPKSNNPNIVINGDAFGFLIFISNLTNA